MHYFRSSIPLSPLFASVALADYLTPTYPPPIDLSSNGSLVTASWINLTSSFDDYLPNLKNETSSSLAGVEDVTFSVGMFSLHDPSAINLQFHHTGPETINASIGTNSVDGDSIYRIASVSKLITTFTGLVALAEDDWNRPLSQIIPGLHDYVQSHANNSDVVYTTQWDQITPWALATQLSGVSTVGWPVSDLAVEVASLGARGSSLLKTYGLPPVNISNLGPCATDPIANSSDTFCSAPDGIEAVKDLPPNFLPWTTPAYSDEGFMLLGIAISNLTGKPLSNVYQDAVFGPLAMNSTLLTHPTGGDELARAVVSGDVATDFALETGFTTPSGGILSTINDLSRLGVAILNNTLLSANTTRKWMKPQSHTASLSYSIGGPWEIHRYVHPGTTRVTDLYTKLGDSGSYGGALVIIPQYDAGFTMLNAYSNSTTRSSAALVILDYVTNTVLPALEAQAALEATSNYVGTYVSTDSNLNASVTIAFNESSVPGIVSGLSVTEWIFNGSNVLSANGLFEGFKPRLEPSISMQARDGLPGKVAFQASTNVQYLTYTSAMEVPSSGVIGTWTGFYATNGDFVYTGENVYDGVATNLFVFDVDGEGRATACSPAVQRVTLTRKGA